MDNLEETQALIHVGHVEILAITQQSFADCANEAFRKFRRGVVRAEGCKQASQLLGGLQRKPSVLCFLMQLADFRKRLFHNQVLEVMQILLRCPTWLEAVQGDEKLCCQLLDTFESTLQDAFPCIVERAGKLPETEQVIKAPDGCTVENLDRKLGDIRCGLESASFGDLTNPGQMQELVESIRITTAWLAWGEKYDKPSFLELFRKHTILEAFAAALRMDACCQELKLQIWQSISYLMPELKHATSLAYFVCVLNTIFENPPNMGDDEYDYFVSLMKGMTLRLTADNAHLYIKPKEHGPDAGSCFMPILHCAAGLVCHPEWMAHIAARVAVLTVLSLDSPEVRDIAEKAVKKVLMPELALVVSCIRQYETMKDCKWRWAEKSNPFEKLHWSEVKPIENTINDIHLQKQPRRGIILYFLPSEETKAYGTVDDAQAETKQHRPSVSRENLCGFIEELLELQQPLKATAKEIQALKKLVQERQ